MKGLAIAWVMIVAVAGSILGIVGIVNAAGNLFPAIITFGGACCVFAMGMILTKER